MGGEGGGGQNWERAERAVGGDERGRWGGGKEAVGEEESGTGLVLFDVESATASSTDPPGPAPGTRRRGTCAGLQAAEPRGAFRRAL